MAPPVTSTTETRYYKPAATFRKEGGGQSAGSPNTRKPSEVKTIKCFHCQQEGHFARDCRAPKKEITCFVCKKTGHIASHCDMVDKRVKQEPEKVEQVNVIDCTPLRDAGEKFIREIKIENIPITACTITSSFVLIGNFKIISKKSVLKGFGEKLVESPGVINEIMYFENLKPRPVEFRIVPDTAQNYPIILGRLFAEALDLLYVWLGYQLWFHEVDPSLFIASNDSGVHMRASEGVT